MLKRLTHAPVHAYSGDLQSASEPVQSNKPLNPCNCLVAAYLTCGVDDVTGCWIHDGLSKVPQMARENQGNVALPRLQTRRQNKLQDQHCLHRAGSALVLRLLQTLIAVERSFKISFVQCWG